MYPSAQLFSQWTQIATINTSQLNAVKFFNEFSGIAVGQGGVWRSTNSGVNWVQVLTGVNLNSVSFSAANTGFVVGDSGKIYKTTDNGLSWNTQSSSTTVNLYSVSFPSMNTGYSVGGSGIVLRTSNGGTSWNNQFTFGNDLYEIKMKDINTGFIVGSVNSEVVLSTANGGANWLPLVNVSGSSLKSITIIGISTIIAVGVNGRIRRTSNYGINWTFPASGTSQQLNSIVFLGQITGYIAGNFGTILKSTDEGMNWTAQSSGTGFNLRGISLINKDTGWAVGQNGIVMRTGIPVGINKSSVSQPTKFTLYQNYPNPFNSSTKLKFDLNENGLVKINIYDVLGRIVQELVNETLMPGSYEVLFDANKFSSGIYYCELDSHNFKKIIKVNLIK